MTLAESSSPPSPRKGMHWSQWLALLATFGSLLSFISSALWIARPTGNHLALFWLAFLGDTGQLVLWGVCWVCFFGSVITTLLYHHTSGWLLWLVPLLLVGSALAYISSLGDIILGTATLNGEDYYLLQIPDGFLSDYYNISLSECGRLDLSCQSHTFYWTYSPIIELSWALVPNKTVDRLYVLLNDQLVYQQGPRAQPTCYEHHLALIGGCKAPTFR